MDEIEALRILYEAVVYTDDEDKNLMIKKAYYILLKYFEGSIR